ncbi:putative virion structural protein [Vibrio phage pVa-21]|nr:putative virion structural protein [Vibrio phage pVa-21]
MSIGGKKRRVEESVAETENVGWEQDPHNPLNIDGVVENKPVVTKVQERRSVVDSEYTPITHLILHSSGDMWTVDYYRQLIGLDDMLRPLSFDVDIAEQNYELIKGFKLRVDDPLQPEQDTETKEFNVTGSGAITHGIVPNTGDMFVADIGNGKAGLLAVTSSEKASYTKDAAYLIRWVLVSEMDDEKWANELARKVSKTLHYVDELAEMYDTPFMTESAFNTYVSLARQDERLIEYFKELFWSKEVHSIRMADQDEKIYDGFHARFCRDLGLTDVRRPIKTYSLGRLDDEDVNTLWDLFDEMDTYRMPMLHRDFVLNMSKSMPGLHVMRTIAWSPFTWALVPEGVIDDIDGEVEFRDGLLTPEVVSNGKGPTMLPEALRARFNLAEKPLYDLVTFKPYVLSTAFYDGNRAEMNILEQMLHRALCNEVVPPEVVDVLTRELFTEPRLSIYYYTPLILVLIHYCKRGGI